MIKVKAKWNDTTKEVELSNKLSFKSRLKWWSKRNYFVDSYNFSYDIGMTKDATVAPTLLSTWSK